MYDPGSYLSKKSGSISSLLKILLTTSLVLHQYDIRRRMREKDKKEL